MPREWRCLPKCLFQEQMKGWYSQCGMWSSNQQRCCHVVVSKCIVFLTKYTSRGKELSLHLKEQKQWYSWRTLWERKRGADTKLFMRYLNNLMFPFCKKLSFWCSSRAAFILIGIIINVKVKVFETNLNQENNPKTGGKVEVTLLLIWVQHDNTWYFRDITSCMADAHSCWQFLLSKRWEQHIRWLQEC